MPHFVLPPAVRTSPRFLSLTARRARALGLSVLAVAAAAVVAACGGDAPPSAPSTPAPTLGAAVPIEDDEPVMPDSGTSEPTYAPDYTNPVVTWQVKNVPKPDWKYPSISGADVLYNVGDIPEFTAALTSDANLDGYLTFRVADKDGFAFGDDAKNTRGATWNSSNTAVAAVVRHYDATWIPKELFHAYVDVRGPGTTMLTLTLDPNDAAKKRIIGLKLIVEDKRGVYDVKIRFSPASATIQVGETGRLAVQVIDSRGAVVSPVEQVVFSGSSNLTIAPVPGSLSQVAVQPVSGRSGTVTATYRGMSAQAAITIPGPLHTLTLSTTDAPSLAGNSCAVISADRRDDAGQVTTQGGVLTWAVSQPGAATVTPWGADRVKVCGGSEPGTFSVTARSETGVSASYTLKHYVITSITLSPTSVTLTGGGSATVTATVFGDVGSGPQELNPELGYKSLDVYWWVDDESLASVTQGARSTTISGRGVAGTTTLRASLGGVTAAAAVRTYEGVSVLFDAPMYFTETKPYTWNIYVSGGDGSHTYKWEYYKSDGYSSGWRLLLSDYVYPIYGPTVTKRVDCATPSVIVRVTITWANGTSIYKEQPSTNAFPSTYPLPCGATGTTYW